MNEEYLALIEMIGDLMNEDIQRYINGIKLKPDYILDWRKSLNFFPSCVTEDKSNIYSQTMLEVLSKNPKLVINNWLGNNGATISFDLLYRIYNFKTT